METNHVLNELQVIRKKKALSSLWDFIQVYLTGDDDHESSSAHIEIMHYLDALLKNLERKLAIAAPRSFGKTAIMTAFIIYALCLKKYKYILVLSHTSRQAKDLLNNVSLVVKNSEHLLEDFSEELAQLRVRAEWNSCSVDSKMKIKIKISAFGLTQGFRGTKFGKMRPDLVIVDDLDSDNYACSKEVKEKMRQIFDGKVLKIGHEGTNIIFNGNIFSQNTLIWDIFNDDKYKDFKKLPYQAIVSFPDRMDLWEKYLNILIGDEKYYDEPPKEAAEHFFRDHKPLMLPGFKSLWPQAWSPTYLMSQYLLDPDRFKREMQNEPASGEALFNPDEFTYWNSNGQSRQALLDSFGKDYTLVVGFDWATGKAKGDYSALALVAKHKNKYYVLKVLLLRERTESVFDHIFTLLREGGNTVVMEANGCQDYLADQLEGEAMKRKVLLKLERIKYHGASKEQRIGSLKPYINVGTISFNKDDHTFLQQMRVFPYGGHDDGPDAVEMAVRVLMQMKEGLTFEKAQQMKGALERLSAEKEFPITKTIHQQMFPKVYKGREESMIRHFPRLKGWGSGKISWY